MPRVWTLTSLPLKSRRCERLPLLSIAKGQITALPASRTAKNSACLIDTFPAPPLSFFSRRAQNTKYNKKEICSASDTDMLFRGEVFVQVETTVSD